MLMWLLSVKQRMSLAYDIIKIMLLSSKLESPLVRLLSLRICAIAWIILCLGACSTTPNNAEDLCSIFEQKRGWYKASVKAADKWNNPIYLPMAIIYQESTFRKRARPPRKKYFGFIPGKRISTAYGYAQVLNGTWREYKNTTGEHWRKRNDFADALDFVHYYMTRAAKENGVSNTDPYNLYLNYHEGLAGFRRQSYLKKPWLLKVARRVQERASRYAEQYASCRKSLQRGWFARLFGL